VGRRDTRTSDDQWRLSWRAPHARRTSSRRAIDTIQRRLAVPVGEREGKTRGYASRRERFPRRRRPRVLKARLARVEERIEAGYARVVRGGRGLLRRRRFLADRLAAARREALAAPSDPTLTAAVASAEAELAAWKRVWTAERLFLTADGEAGKRFGNESIHVDPAREVVSPRLPTPPRGLANARHGRYEIPLVNLFSHLTSPPGHDDLLLAHPTDRPLLLRLAASAKLRPPRPPASRRSLPRTRVEWAWRERREAEGYSALPADR
jgi:hypothetical protein